MRVPSTTIFCIIVLALSACKHRRQDELKTYILGDWKTLDKVVDSRRMMSGISFHQDMTCDVKPGYFKQFFKSEDSRVLSFLGTKTRYTIAGDILKVFNLADSTWEQTQILHTDSNTLKLCTISGDTSTYTRLQKQSHVPFQFDQIIVSSSGCEGSCPINSTLISNQGIALYYGERYNVRNGVFQFNIDPEIFKTVARAFQNVTLSELKNVYRAPWSDDEAVVVTFISKGRIKKTIVDYGRVAPSELCWAYTPVRYLYQSSRLKKPEGKNAGLVFRATDFKSRNKIIVLAQTEGFYLLSLLQQATEITRNFKTKYVLRTVDEESPKLIETDGRFYKITWKSGKQNTFDLGYDFLEHNDLLKKERLLIGSDEFYHFRIY